MKVKVIKLENSVWRSRQYVLVNSARRALQNTPRLQLANIFIKQVM